MTRPDPTVDRSVGLLLQVSLPCAMFASGQTRLTLRGGTNAAFAPQIDYTVEVFRPLLERFGGNLHCDVKRRWAVASLDIDFLHLGHYRGSIFLGGGYHLSSILLHFVPCSDM